jgi:Tfp pilus assembly protein PilV
MRHRTGTSLCETLLALVLLAATAAWGLQAATAAQRAVGDARARQAALHRAQWALADLDAIPCDSTSAPRTLSEARWSLAIARTRDGHAYRDDVTLRAVRGDTLRLQHSAWCD